ncbi:DUF1007 family protein [Citreimonas salinaria]|uniref:ABC-type uncharacterized transport system, substrate-binding protein n=1 Tax=Citreimonas salinaria TaxID=321339 RepID=A0A1H3MTH0_9RHOB|nr:DUF1007 family protein [Citreimonas salinaria]SDY79750.1 ABC-type uncharacterized transport system, substrate-binding protein [Citreimonas salinaria]
MAAFQFPTIPTRRRVSSRLAAQTGRAAALALLAAAVLAFTPAPARAHPHVFIDGGVDFVFRDGTALDALRVTWRYDEFETLYTLSSFGLALNTEGDLDEADRQTLIRLLSDWPEDFDGSAHLSIEGEAIELEWPTELDARMVDGRLEMTFIRKLPAPVSLDGQDAEVAFYESTYFFAFTVADEPQLLDAPAQCAATVIPFDPDGQTDALRSALAKLGREETPEMKNVGALFADRIAVTCD